MPRSRATWLKRSRLDSAETTRIRRILSSHHELLKILSYDLESRQETLGWWSTARQTPQDHSNEKAGKNLLPRGDRRLVFCAGARGDEEKISLDKVPAAVLKAVKKKFPKADVKDAVKEVEDGTVTFEIGLKLDGLGIDVALKEDGTILEVEKEIAVADLPKVVVDAATARYPDGEIKKAEEIVKDEKTTYEVTVVHEGKNRQVAIAPDGKLLKNGEAEEKKD